MFDLKKSVQSSGNPADEIHHPALTTPGMIYEPWTHSLVGHYINLFVNNNISICVFFSVVCSFNNTLHYFCVFCTFFFCSNNSILGVNIKGGSMTSFLWSQLDHPKWRLSSAYLIQFCKLGEQINYRWNDNTQK